MDRANSQLPRWPSTSVDIPRCPRLAWPTAPVPDVFLNAGSSCRWREGATRSNMIEWPWAFRSVHLLEVGRGPRLVEERFSRRVEAEIGEPAFARLGLHPVRFLAGGPLGAKVDVDRAVAVLHKVFLARGKIRPALLGNDHLSRPLVVGGDGPELLGRWIRRDAQPIGIATGKPIAVAILVGRDVALPDTGSLAQHPLRDADSLVEPGGAFVELIEAGLALIDRRHKRVLPLCAGPEGRLDTLVRCVRLGHGFAHDRGLFENFLLARVRLKRLALFDAKEPKLREDQSIPLHHRFGLHERVDALPVGHATRRHLGAH